MTTGIDAGGREKGESSTGEQREEERSLYRKGSTGVHSTSGFDGLACAITAGMVPSLVCGGWLLLVSHQARGRRGWIEIEGIYAVLAPKFRSF